MLATPIDISVSSKKQGKTSGTRTIVFQERKKDLLALSGQFADDLAIMTDVIQEGMKQLLAPYIGPALVLDVPAGEINGTTLLPIFDKLAQTPEGFPPRLIFKSGWKGSGKMPSLTVDAVEYLYANAVGLIGVDWPTLDEPDELVPYLLKKNGMVWLVDLDLSNVSSDKMYFLSALPLRTTQDEEIACRAMLIPL